MFVVVSTSLSGIAVVILYTVGPISPLFIVNQACFRKVVYKPIWKAIVSGGILLLIFWFTIDSGRMKNHLAGVGLILRIRWHFAKAVDTHRL
uniref:Uncharacterized protein n=1 Tax=Panagrolaimus sp. JU765 TaxID=591449 RepID=A0AC34PUC4_9BILA